MTHGTASEMATARRWAATFDAGELPISFLYGDQAAAESDQNLAERASVTTAGLPARGTHCELP